MRIIVDANVLVSAAIRTGPSHRIVQAWLREGAFEVVACPQLLAEVRDVLTQRPRLRRWIDLEAAETFLATLETYATIVPDPVEVPAETRDPEDDYLIAVARAHGIDHIVTGDQDLLAWDGPPGLVITPAQFEALG